MIATMSPASALPLDFQAIALGLPVPVSPHAISVSLPTWRDNVGYEEGDKRVVDAMVSGYPRFFIHLSVKKLARACERKLGIPGEKCMIFPSKAVANHCRTFLINQPEPPATVRLIEYYIGGSDDSTANGVPSPTSPISPTTAAINASRYVVLHVVFFPENAFPLAKQFWQHTGMGISSRLAEYCLSMMPAESHTISGPSSPITTRFTKSSNKHYSARPTLSPLPSYIRSLQTTDADDVEKDHTMYLEERYGRNLPVGQAAMAKRALRRRIAGVLVRDSPSEECGGGPCAGAPNVELGPSSRGVKDVTEDDVYLFQSGMSAIWNAHNLATSVRPRGKSICFGFPYTDTLKILQKWGYGCLFFGNGLDSDIDALEAALEKDTALALFTEFPSNPLLRSANLPRLRQVADKHDFLIVVDETLGNFVNVEVLPYVDIVVSSLSKIFSGDANVMGGSLVLNPAGRHYAELKGHLESTYEDNYFDEDAIFMERNSRDFERRIPIIDSNTEAVCDLLRSRSVVGGHAKAAIKNVFYPKWETRDNFDRCRVKDADQKESGGFGGLFAVTFTSTAASHAFFDALPCHKGPSLGTNFTLACPYTVLAHFTELEWAAQFGVDENLVRVAIGLEGQAHLLRTFETALNAAERTL